MCHLIEFNTSVTVGVEIIAGQRLEIWGIREGTQVFAHILPRVIETHQGPVEVADLCLEDGSVVHEVPFAQFRFVEP